MPVIEVHDVHKRYDEVDAVRGVSFAVERGEVFCLLGPNGAGKTTITEILEGHRLPTSGAARCSATTPAAATATCAPASASSCNPAASRRSSPSASCSRCTAAGTRARCQPDHLIDLVELDAKPTRSAGELSGGQRRRLDLALGLVGDPDVLFLDEPTTGFDPHARRNAWSTLRTLCDSGKTIFLTTHFMDEAQYLADRVAVMVDGRDRRASARPRRSAAATSCRPRSASRCRTASRAHDLPALPAPPSARSATASSITTAEGIGATHAITGWALERNIALTHFSVSQPTLEDVYLALTETATTEEVRMTMTAAPSPAQPRPQARRLAGPLRRSAASGATAAPRSSRWSSRCCSSSSSAG